jgi:epoxyqueuosine reductase
VSSLKERVVAVALAAGADAVRIAAASDDEAARVHLQVAFARGDFPAWPYDAAYARQATSPQALLPGARSVVCVAVGFATPPPGRPGPLEGRVSNYAWGEDYHAALRRIAAAVAAELDASAGAPVTRVACDAVPLAERAFAARAGLGWIGKHTNLIAPHLGSYVFLAEVLTTLALEADPPLRTSCGSCTRCIVACPTGALRGDGSIDAGRCISDLTQRRDAIPLPLRPLMGGWVWGCDLCQEACPPTQRAGRHGQARFAPAGRERAYPDLLRLLALRSSEFKRRFRRTAMGWRGPAVLRRNAAVALGNRLDRAAVPALREALRDDRAALVRGHAAWALGRIGSPAAQQALREAAHTESDVGVRLEIDGALKLFEQATR